MERENIEVITSCDVLPALHCHEQIVLLNSNRSKICSGARLDDSDVKSVTEPALADLEDHQPNHCGTVIFIN
jgi:hypothetical protein